MTVVVFGAEELADLRFAASPLAHLVHGVHGSACSAGSGLRERWWASARGRVPAVAVPLVQLINADAMVMPQFLLPPAVPALAAHEPTLDAELERLEANWAAS